jgi:hypothetical protein
MSQALCDTCDQLLDRAYEATRNQYELLWHIEIAPILERESDSVTNPDIAIQQAAMVREAALDAYKQHLRSCGAG